MSHKIEKFTTVWAESGTTTPAPTTEKKELGFVDDERPAHERLNFLQNRAENKLNDLAVERVSSTYEDATDAAAMITTGLWGADSWGQTSDTANTISGGGTKEYRDIKSYFTSAGEPRLLVLDNANTTIEVWNPRTRTLIITTNDLHDDLPAAGATWEPYSMCTDGTYVYVMAADTNAAPDTHIIQSWAISESSADWAVRTGWAATGTALMGTGNQTTVGAGACIDGVIIVASSTRLACLCGWTTIAGIGSEAVQIIDITDGTIDSDGAGDAPIGDNAQGSGSICSDGTNVFFSVYGVAGPMSICSATIADPTAGCTGANYPFTPAGSTHIGALATCGPDIIVNCLSGNSEADPIIQTHNSTDADLETIVLGQDSGTVPLVGEKYLVSYAYDVCFDGLNYWIYGRQDGGLEDLSVLVKVDVSKLFTLDIQRERHLGDIASAYAMLPGVDGVPVIGIANSKYQRCTFDGRDVWCNPEARASQPYSGKLYRLPLALLRS